MHFPFLITTFAQDVVVVVCKFNCSFHAPVVSDDNDSVLHEITVYEWELNFPIEKKSVPISYA